MFHQQWVLALLGTTATVSGLAGSYIATALVTSQPSVQSADGDRALLSREQAFPPSERWPGNPHELARNVLFEDAAPGSQWLSQREADSAAASAPAWSSPVTEARHTQRPDLRPDHGTVEQPIDVAPEPGLAIQSDVPLSEDSWGTEADRAPSELTPALDVSDIDSANGGLEIAPAKPAAPLERGRPVPEAGPASPTNGAGPATDSLDPDNLDASGFEKARLENSWTAPATQVSPVNVSTGGSRPQAAP